MKRKFITTTDSNHRYRMTDNVINRNFKVLNLGEKWGSGIIYVRIGNYWNYLTIIIDLTDRKVVGWSLSEDMIVENTIYRARLSARNTRQITREFIFHSDRGVQYASKKMLLLLGMNIKITQIYE